jgi:hypothetical protein
VSRNSDVFFVVGKENNKYELNLILTRINCLLILSDNKENVTFTWPVGVQYVLFFFTITQDQFVIYIPICRYTCMTFPITFIRFLNRATRQVPLVELELPIGAAELITAFKWISCCSIISFQHSILSTIVCLFAPFLLIIVLSVLRITASDYPFGIFKSFFI